MSCVFSIAYKRRHAGNFAKLKNVWEALQTLEGSPVLGDHLLLVDRRPEATCEVVELTYARLCSQLRACGRADIRDARDEEPLPIKYAIWELEMNVLNMSVLMENGS